MITAEFHTEHHDGVVELRRQRPDDRRGRRRSGVRANGNTTAQSGIPNIYDFVNRPIQHGGVTIVYDGDGNRVSETAGGVTTNYLVDTENPTGYAQVVEELQGGAVVRNYTWGHWLISATQQIDSTWKTSYYGYDGHGSVRFLTDASGAVNKVGMPFWVL